jgi:integrase
MSLPSRHPADNPLPLPPPAPAGATAKRPTKTKGRRRRAGEGSIYQRADGRWVAAVRLPDGARRYFYAKTQREAIDKLRASQRALDDGLPLGDGRLTVERFLHTWLESVRGAIRPSTYSSYELAVRRLLPRIGRIRLAALDPAAVQHAYTALQDAGLAASSVRLTHRVLHAALKQAVRWGLVGRNVTDLVRAPRPEAREMRTLTAEQLAALFSATETAGDRLHALWVLLATTGLRLGEALGLRWEDVDLTGGRLTVTRALQRQRGQGMQFVEPKSAAGRRTVFLSQVAVAALRAHRARQLEERLAAGPLWEDIGLVFTTTPGHAAGRAARRPPLPAGARPGRTAARPRARPAAHGRHAVACRRHAPQGRAGAARARDHRHHAGHLRPHRAGDASAGRRPLRRAVRPPAAGGLAVPARLARVPPTRRGGGCHVGCHVGRG